MVSKYMDPGIAGRDYDTATSMIAKGQAVFMIMGDWQIGIFTAAGLKHAAGLPVRAGADRLGQARLHPQFGLGRLLQAEGPGLRRGPDSCSPISSCRRSSRPCSIRPRARFPPASTSISKDFNPCQQQSLKDLAGLDRRRNAGALDGPQHDHPAEVSRRDPGHHHRLREQPENDPGRSRQRDGGRRRRAKVSKSEAGRAAPQPRGRFCSCG